MKTSLPGPDITKGAFVRNLMLEICTDKEIYTEKREYKQSKTIVNKFFSQLPGCFEHPSFKPRPRMLKPWRADFRGFLACSTWIFHLQALQIPIIHKHTIITTGTRRQPFPVYPPTLPPILRRPSPGSNCRRSASSRRSCHRRTRHRRRTRLPAQFAYNRIITSRFLNQIHIPRTRISLARESAWDPGVLVCVIPQCDTDAASGAQAGKDGVVVVCCLLCQSACERRQRRVPGVELSVGDFDAQGSE
jgi:hypothetical protein